MKNTPTELLDLARLAAISVGSGKPQAALLADFRRINADDAALMRGAIRKRDLQRAASLAHRLRGAAVMLGAHPFAATCHAIAQAGTAGDTEQVELAMARFELQHADLNRYIDSLDSASSNEAHAMVACTDSALLCADLRSSIVEDHEFQRAIASRMLLRFGVRETRQFGDAGSALRAWDAQSTPCDIMLLDLCLPGMSAMELLRALADRHCGMSVILNSALDAEALAERVQSARSCGMTVLGALCKPLTRANLAPLIAIHRSNLLTEHHDS